MLINTINNTKMQNFVDRETVSSSVYLYGCEAWEFELPVEAQVAFLAEREEKVELIITALLEDGYGEADSERLRECLSTRKWIEKMYKQLGVK